MTAVPTRRELFAWMIAFALVVTTVLGSMINRAGAEGSSPSTEVAFIATGLNFPDALAAAAGAGMLLAPVLLVQTNSVPAETEAELERLAPETIYIVGGTGTISAGVQTTLENLSFTPTVTRVGGGNRYATAAGLSGVLFPTSGLYPRAGHAQDDNMADGNGAIQTPLSVTIDAPRDGTLLINAGSDAFLNAAGLDEVKCWIYVDDVLATGSERWVQRYDATNNEENCTTEVGIYVAAGVHTIHYRISAGLNTQLGHGALTVLWIPFDQNGAVPSPPGP